VSVARQRLRPADHIGAPTGLRAVVYRRVSREEQVEGYSLDAQTRAVASVRYPRR
jgi:hypothetical protein